jgi:hypothetical protein
MTGDLAKVRVNGANFNLRAIRTLNQGRPDRFGVNPWLHAKYSLTYQQVLPFFTKQPLDRQATNLILFSDDSSWKDADLEWSVADYARDLGATVTVGPGGATWYTIPYPQPFSPLPDWARGILRSAKLILVLQRLRGYPESLSATALNNLAILITYGPEYFFFRCPADQVHAEDMIFAVSIDTGRPAFVINLESEIPRFYPPGALGGWLR